MNARLLTASLALASATIAIGARADARTLSVGSGMMYANPSDAAAAAMDGDIIEISPGTYRDVATWHANNLTIRGVGATRPHLDAMGLTIPNGKAIWVIQGMNTTVENIEFSGAAVSDANGAGIRQEGPGLTVRNSFFHDNQDGILAGDNATSDILIESTEFDHNGAGDGQSHNMYINHVRTFTLRGCFTHNASIGHLVKSRALTTFILYNRILDEDGTPSYEIDLPNGGAAYIIGNVIQQGPNTDNSTIVSFAAEGGSNPMQEFYFVNNTVVNDRSAGTFIRLNGTPMARIVNNIFAGPGTVLNGTAMQTSNLNSDTPGFADRTGRDYHLVAGAAAIDMGTDPGMVGTQSLTPVAQYTNLATETRMMVGSALDVGAYEFGNVPTMGSDAGADVVTMTDSGSGTDAATGSDVVSTGDATTGTDSGPRADGSSDAGPGDAAVNPMNNGSCGCRVPGGEPSRGDRGALVALAAVAAVIARRRSRDRG